MGFLPTPSDKKTFMIAGMPVWLIPSNKGASIAMEYASGEEGRECLNALRNMMAESFTGEHYLDENLFYMNGNMRCLFIGGGDATYGHCADTLERMQSLSREDIADQAAKLAETLHFREASGKEHEEARFVTKLNLEVKPLMDTVKAWSEKHSLLAGRTDEDAKRLMRELRDDLRQLLRNSRGK